MTEDALQPTFRVRIERDASFSADDLIAMLEKAARPRPGQEFTVRILRERFAAEVVYIRYPEAPAFEVSFAELVVAWGALWGAEKVSGMPYDLDVGECLAVIDAACRHLVHDRTSITSATTGASS